MYLYNHMILNNKFSRHLLLLLILAAIGWGTGTQAAEGLFPNATVMAPPPQPTQMPAFDFANLQGGALKSSEMKGKVIIIRFWATW